MLSRRDSAQAVVCTSVKRQESAEHKILNYVCMYSLSIYPLQVLRPTL